jgi:hypothetical protein
MINYIRQQWEELEELLAAIEILEPDYKEF